jgi:hypothetical protein
MATNMPWLNEQYTSGIIKLLCTKTALQLSDINGKYLQAMIAYLIGIHVYPLPDTNRHKPLFLDCWALYMPYIRAGHRGKRTDEGKSQGLSLVDVLL